MSEQVLQSIESHATHRAVEVALCELNDAGNAVAQLTYGQLQRRVDFAVAQLRQQQKPGDVILLQLQNGSDYTILFLAILKADMVVLPVHPGEPEMEVQRLMGSSGAKRTIRTVDVAAWRGEADSAGAATALNSAGLMLRTSGTTGLPKIVFRNAKSLDAVARNVADAVRLQQGDRVMVTIPMCHSYGIENALLAPLLAGSTLVICPRFDAAQIPAWCINSKATLMPGVPFMFEMLANIEASKTLASLRLAYSAGAILPESVFHSFYNRCGLRLGQLYGATEIGSVTFNDPDSPHFEPLSVGQPMQGVRIRIVPEPAADGQSSGSTVQVLAPSMMSRYIGDAEDAIRDGYFLTGDLGALDAKGNLSISGRLKLLVDVGGMKVNPLEVEAAIAEHDRINECVVVPLQVTDTLTRLKAYFTALGDDPIDSNELRAFARQRLASFKVPRVFEQVDSLPRSAMGKVQRRVLMEMASR